MILYKAIAMLLIGAACVTTTDWWLKEGVLRHVLSPRWQIIQALYFFFLRLEYRYMWCVCLCRGGGRTHPHMHAHLGLNAHTHAGVFGHRNTEYLVLSKRWCTFGGIYLPDNYTGASKHERFSLCCCVSLCDVCRFYLILILLIYIFYSIACLSYCCEFCRSNFHHCSSLSLIFLYHLFTSMRWATTTTK